MKRYLFLIMLLIVGWCIAGIAHGETRTVEFAWDHDTPDYVEYYTLYWGNETGVHPNSQRTTAEEAAAMRMEVHVLEVGQHYYLVATASNHTGESGPSEEINFIMPPVGTPILPIDPPFDLRVIPRR